MKVGVPKEVSPERRVALVPDVVARLVGSGFEVLVERGAGEAASFTDAAFTEAGATVEPKALGAAEAIAKVNKPSAEQVAELRKGDILIAFLQPLTDEERIERLRRRGRARVRDGVDPADDARAVDGRALVAGDRRRLQGACCSPPSACRASSRC